MCVLDDIVLSMPHCSYVCNANAGKIETCSNLLNPGNSTLMSLPDMASCPASTAAMNDCFVKCGCQCTRSILTTCFLLHICLYFFDGKKFGKQMFMYPFFKNALFVKGNLNRSGFEKLMKLSAGQFHRLFSSFFLFKQQDNLFL
jgi:hypothetical protein